jgi:hypothetical protein
VPDLEAGGTKRIARFGWKKTNMRACFHSPERCLSQ